MQTETHATPDIPCMNDPAVFDSLRVIGKSWTGAGVAVECGTWLGASLAALAEGLVIAGYDRELHCFDVWEANQDEVRKAKAQGVTIRYGQNLMPLMVANVKPIYPRLSPHRGHTDRVDWRGGPIEIFVLDAAKREPHFGKVLQTFAPHWIAGRTILCLLDYSFFEKYEDKLHREIYGVQARWVESCGGALEPMPGLDAGSARFFRVMGKVPTDAR